MVSVDSTTCRAHQHAAGASTRGPKIPGRRRSPARHRPDEALGRSRGGLTSKIHSAGEGGWRPLAFVITPGQWGDAPQMIPVLEEIHVPRQAGGRPRARPDHVGGDKAYSSRRIRRQLRRRQIKHTIPEARDQRANLRRNKIERTINQLKNFRAVATRFGKRAYVFHGTVTVAEMNCRTRSTRVSGGRGVLPGSARAEPCCGRCTAARPGRVRSPHWAAPVGGNARCAEW